MHCNKLYELTFNHSIELYGEYLGEFTISIVYSLDINICKNAMNKYKKFNGFKLYPDSFKIIEHEIDNNNYELNVLTVSEAHVLKYEKNIQNKIYTYQNKKLRDEINCINSNIDVLESIGVNLCDYSKFKDILNKIVFDKENEIIQNNFYIET